FAGLRRPDLDVDIRPLDERTRTEPVPVTGVLGADLLAGQVLEVRPDPCRFRLSARASAPERPLAPLPLGPSHRVPLIRPSVSDGPRAKAGLFAVGLGVSVGAQLGSAHARMEGAPPGADNPTAPLRALSLGGLLVEDPIAAIADPPAPGAVGAIGEPVWARYT